MTDMGRDVIVIGAGMVGLSVAHALLDQGWQVTVVDPDEPQSRASFGNAGVISPGSIFPVAGPGVLPKLPRYALGRDVAVRLRLSALREVGPWLPRFVAAANEPAWRRTAAALAPLVALGWDQHRALAARLGTQALLRRTGYLRLFRHSQAEAATRREREVLALHAVRAELLDQPALADLEPELAHRFASGLFLPDAGSADTPGEVVAACAAALRQRGGFWIRGKAAALVVEPDGVRVACSGQMLHAAFCVLAAGAWSARLLRPLGLRIPMAAERGYHVQMQMAPGAKSPPLGRPAHDAGGGYVMAPMSGGVRVLSGVELGAPDSTPDHRQINEVAADAARSLPLIRMPGVEAWAGSRPSTPDGLPVLGFAPGHSRLFLSFGHGHIGFGTGPATGRIVAQMLAGRPTDIPVAPFHAKRFERWL